MGHISPALDKQLTELGQRLNSATSPDDVSQVIDDLLDLTSGTPAEDYVNELIARCDLAENSLTREVGPVLESYSGPALPGARITQAAAASFGAALTQPAVVTEVMRVPIFFGTNRTPATLAANAFTGDFHKTVTYGVATVTIPTGHKPGDLETPKWWNLFGDKADRTKYFTLPEVISLTQTDFATKLESAAQTTKTAELLIFLHGFNVTFEEAAMRAAQFVCDSGFAGIVLLFSWPSRGKLPLYWADEDSAVSSGDILAGFLKGLVGGPWPRVHLLAHSMGNRVLLLGLADNPRPDLKLGQLVFAAADVFVPMFDEKFAKLQSAGLWPATSYASKDDRALIVSSWLHRGPRVGLVEQSPYLTNHLAAIDATSVDNGILGHGYWSAAPALLSDLKALLQTGESPIQRKLNPIEGYWTFPSSLRQ
jgi:esterase/lipase superfamily enzyme